MRRLDQISIEYPTHGGQSGSGQLTSIGTPDQDMLRVVVREAVQNVWDARYGTPECIFRLRRLSPDQIDALGTLLGQSPDVPQSEPLLDLFQSGDVQVLEISDYGTRGLQGPIRCQESVADGMKSDFVDFMYKSGSPRDHVHGGGTHGVGSNSLYALSSCNMICAYSRAMRNNESRFMIGRLTDPFDPASR